jgi:hypothetical protein
MKELAITVPNKSQMRPVLEGLAEAGWVPLQVPEGGCTARNRQLLVLQTANREARFRLLVYKVTGSSRGKPDERRIQITSTYQKRLPRLCDYQDAVLGFDKEHCVFVGVDPRRLEHGGPTGNASTFFDRAGLDWSKEDEVLIRLHAARLFPDGSEFHAFFRPPCLAEYLLNIESIHIGSYSGYGPYSYGVTRQYSQPASLVVAQDRAEGNKLVFRGPEIKVARQRLDENLIDAYEQSDNTKLRQARLSPTRFRIIQKQCEETGHIGEQFVIDYERRRLRRAGREDLAQKVQWISQESVTEGYDILSFEVNGDERWIEVKTTAGCGQVFVMTDNEWQTALGAGEKYYIYRVIEARTEPRVAVKINNPSELEAQGLIKRSALGWRVTLV